MFFSNFLWAVGRGRGGGLGGVVGGEGEVICNNLLLKCQNVDKGPDRRL